MYTYLHTYVNTRRHSHTYIFIYTHIYTCKHTYTHVHTYTRTYVRTNDIHTIHTTVWNTLSLLYIHTYIHTHTDVHTYIFIYTHIYTRTCTHTYIQTDVHTYTFIYTHVYTCTHTYIRMYIHTTCVRTYIHIDVHTYTFVYTHIHTYIYIRTYIHKHRIECYTHRLYVLEDAEHFQYCTRTFAVLFRNNSKSLRTPNLSGFDPTDLHCSLCSTQALTFYVRRQKSDHSRNKGRIDSQLKVMCGTTWVYCTYDTCHTSRHRKTIRILKHVSSAERSERLDGIQLRSGVASTIQQWRRCAGLLSGAQNEHIMGKIRWRRVPTLWGSCWLHPQLRSVLKLNAVEAANRLSNKKFASANLKLPAQLRL
jgi:hypothetical protein